MRRTTVTLGAAALTVALLAVAPSLSASAFNNSDTVTLPGTSIKLQANAWSPSLVAGGSFDFVTSSKTTKSGAKYKVATIKNTATVEARGVNPSVGIPGGVGVSGDKNTKSISWTNNNAWISDLSGTASYSGLTASLHVNSAAFAFHNGVKKYVDVWSW
jgi:hypothetical protein